MARASYPGLDEFNVTIGTWITFLDQYTLAMLCQQPRPGSWSLGQVYRHITDDTKWYVEQMEQALATDSNSEKDMHEDAKAIFANNGFPDQMIEGPATNTFIPQPQSKEEIKEEMLSIKETVNKLFSTPTAVQAKGKTQHPGLLFFSAEEWLRFAEIHMRHHFRQKKRIDEQILA